MIQRLLPLILKIHEQIELYASSKKINKIFAETELLEIGGFFSIVGKTKDTYF